jgi:hypothetical protein
MHHWPLKTYVFTRRLAPQRRPTNSKFFSGFSPLFQVQMYRTLITRDRLRNDQRSADWFLGCAHSSKNFSSKKFSPKKFSPKKFLSTTFSLTTCSSICNLFAENLSVNFFVEKLFAEKVLAEKKLWFRPFRQKLPDRPPLKKVLQCFLVTYDIDL